MDSAVFRVTHYCYSMTPIADLVKLFYEQLWNQKNLEIANEILDERINFRGSLGSAMVGRAKVCEYVMDVTNALADYYCDVQELVVEGEKASAKVLFKGIHVGEFMDYEPTQKEVAWMGTAFFESSNGTLTNIWVLGDLAGLRSKLEQNKLET